MSTQEIIKQEVASSINTFAQVKIMVDDLTQACNGIVIIDPSSLEKGKDLAKKSKKIASAIEDHRKELTKPFFDAKKSIDDFAKLLTDGLDKATKKLRDQILGYETEQERLRREELRRIEEERRKAEEAKRIAEEAMAKAQEATITDIKSVSLNGDIQLEAVKASNEDIKAYEDKMKELEQSRTKDIRLIWNYEVLNENEIPREYLIIDDRKIKDAIKAGVRSIPGINIFQIEQLNLR